MAVDFTEGALGKSVFRFAVPLLGASLIQLLYSAVDVLFAGNVLGAAGMAALGASSLVAYCAVSFFLGVSVGSNVVAARAFGARDVRGMEKTVGTSLVLAVLWGVVCATVGFFAARFIVVGMGVPASVLDDATLYLQVYFLSLPFIIVYNMASACLRAFGDSQSPLRAQVLGGALNVALDALFLLVIDGGVAGIAWSTFAAQGCACVYALWRLRRPELPCVLRWHLLRLDASTAKEIMRLGFPSGVQSLMMTVSNVLIQYVVNGTGEAGIAAFTAYFRIELLIYEPLVVLGQTVTVLTAQNTGAHCHGRVHKGVRTCLFMGLGSSIVTAAILLLVRQPLMGLFVSDAEVISLGSAIMMTTFPFYWLYAFVETYAGASRGVGNTRVPMCVILVCFACMRLALLYLTPLGTWGVAGIACVYPLTWACAALSLAIYYFKVIHPRMHSLQDNPHPNKSPADCGASAVGCHPVPDTQEGGERALG